MSAVVLKRAVPSARAALLGLGVVLGLGMMSASHAGLLDDDEARKAILDLRAEVRKNDTQQAKELAELNKKIDQLRAEQAQSTAQAATQQDATRRTLLELNNQLIQAREDNAKLRGLIESQANELAQIQRGTAGLAARQKELDTTLDSRLKKLEPRTVAVDGKEAVVDRNEEAAFNGALNQFKAGDYKASIAAYNLFITQNLQSPLIPSAYFWLGNSQYAAREPKNALASLQNFLQKSPDHPRAADAHLTIAYAYNDMGDKRRAQTGFKYVVDTYPNTPAAEAATEQLPKPAPAKKKA